MIHLERLRGEHISLQEKLGFQCSAHINKRNKADEIKTTIQEVKKLELEITKAKLGHKLDKTIVRESIPTGAYEFRSNLFKSLVVKGNNYLTDMNFNDPMEEYSDELVDTVVSVEWLIKHMGVPREFDEGKEPDNKRNLKQFLMSIPGSNSIASFILRKIEHPRLLMAGNVNIKNYKTVYEIISGKKKKPVRVGKKKVVSKNTFPISLCCLHDDRRKKTRTTLFLNTDTFIVKEISSDPLPYSSFSKHSDPKKIMVSTESKIYTITRLPADVIEKILSKIIPDEETDVVSDVETISEHDTSFGIQKVTVNSMKEVYGMLGDNGYVVHLIQEVSKRASTRGIGGQISKIDPSAKNYPETKKRGDVIFTKGNKTILVVNQEKSNKPKLSDIPFFSQALNEIANNKNVKLIYLPESFTTSKATEMTKKVYDEHYKVIEEISKKVSVKMFKIL